MGRQIANAQLIFNLLGVAIAVGFLPLIAHTLERFLPDTETGPEPNLSLADAPQNT